MKKYKYKDKQHPQFPTINNNWFEKVFGFEEKGLKSNYTKDELESFHTDSPVIKNLQVNNKLLIIDTEQLELSFKV